jgi:hypothetical protein
MSSSADLRKGPEYVVPVTSVRREDPNTTDVGYYADGHGSPVSLNDATKYGLPEQAEFAGEMWAVRKPPNDISREYDAAEAVQRTPDGGWELIRRAQS